MAKITRAIQKIFGSTAGADEIAQFGSLAASAPAFTTSPTVIQALSNYLDGWFGAVLGENSPAIEDMNALFYLITYQLSYLMQTGIAEWNAATTYYIGSVVNDGTGLFLISLTDGNLNNALTDTDNWGVIHQSTSTQLSPTTVGGATAVPTPDARDQDTFVIGNTSAPAGHSSAFIGNFVSVAYSPVLVLYVAVSSGASSTTTGIMTSSDGSTWTARTMPNSVVPTSVVWAQKLNLFVCVAQTATASQAVMTSPDGVTWTAHTAPNAVNWTSLCYSPELGLLVAVAKNGTTSQQIMTSPDGSTWTARTSPSGDQWSSVTWAKEIGLFCAVSGNSARSMVSGDGVNWVQGILTQPAGSTSVAWSPVLGLFCATVNSAGTLASGTMYSFDGIVWVSASDGGSGNIWTCITWAEGLNCFIAGGNDGGSGGGGILLASNDAINWVSGGFIIAGVLQISSIIYIKPLNKLIMPTQDTGTAGGVYSLSPAVPITANPQIAVGTYDGQRKTVIGTDNLNQPLINSGNGVYTRKPIYLGNNVAVNLLWSISLNAWIAAN